MHCDTDSSPNNPPSPTVNANRGGHPSLMLKVFLIEDSPLLQELLAGMLSELDGVEFCGCADGETAALRQLAENQADLAIIDIELKQGSGIGVLDALQTDSGLYGKPRKVVLTNYANASMRQRCERFGMDAFFDKSLHINELIDYVVDAANKKSVG
ncbi:MAG: response regulator [Gammaproteobacteria bacterium]|nr:response regulator [Gammaproteobacteria bacterium]MBU4500152.1 response regulator [Gammaproteobacteria bacterium]